jgi:hypothetical protein
MKGEWIKVPVESLRAGDVVDLAGDKYGNHDSAPFEYAIVEDDAVQETPECVRVAFTDIDCFGFPTGHLVRCRTIPVIFRKWPRREGGHVMAIFPTIPSGYSFMDGCDCYQHVGQHGSTDVLITDRTELVRDPAEYADLKRELESYPYFYKLRVLQKWPRVDYRKLCRNP